MATRRMRDALRAPTCESRPHRPTEQLSVSIVYRADALMARGEMLTALGTVSRAARDSGFIAHILAII
jgi:hypothetical protein